MCFSASGIEGTGGALTTGFLVLDDDGGADVVDPDSSFFVVYPLLLPSTTNASFLLALI